MEIYYKGFTVKVFHLHDYDEYDAFGKRRDGKTVFRTYGWKTEEEAIGKLREAIDRATMAGRDTWEEQE